MISPGGLSVHGVAFKYTISSNGEIEESVALQHVSKCGPYRTHIGHI